MIQPSQQVLVNGSPELFVVAAVAAIFSPVFLERVKVQQIFHELFPNNSWATENVEQNNKNPVVCVYQDGHENNFVFE